MALFILSQQGMPLLPTESLVMKDKVSVIVGSKLSKIN